MPRWTSFLNENCLKIKYFNSYVLQYLENGPQILKKIRQNINVRVLANRT
jgi:hypothetical protein